MVFEPELKSHCFRVKSLYKRAARMVEAYYGGARHVVRYQQVLLRHRFDKNACECDQKVQQKMYRDGETELLNIAHPIPAAKFARSYGPAGGVAADRVVTPPDWVLDYWHPLEKDRYPFYFACREQRKCEYLRLWYAGHLT